MNRLKSQGCGLEDHVVCRYTEQMLRAVVYLHGLDIVHGDIHVGNLLVHVVDEVNDYWLKLVLGDFGESVYLQNEPAEKVNMVKRLKSNDIIDVGDTVYEMCTNEELPRYIREVPNKLSHPMRSFVERCLVKPWQSRDTAQQLLDVIIDQLKSSTMNTVPSSSLPPWHGASAATSENKTEAEQGHEVNDQGQHTEPLVEDMGAAVLCDRSEEDNIDD